MLARHEWLLGRQRRKRLVGRSHRRETRAEWRCRRRVTVAVMCWLFNSEQHLDRIYFEERVVR